MVAHSLQAMGFSSQDFVTPIIHKVMESYREIHEKAYIHFVEWPQTQ